MSEASENCARPELLSFAPMIDSEVARLLLRHYRVPYTESYHIFGWVSLLTLPRGGYGRVPLLHGGGLRLSGPRAIAEHYDPSLPAGRRLLPAAQPLRTRIEADWRRFNGELAADTAVVAYFHLLPCRDIMIEPFSRSLPATEAALLPKVYPALRALLSGLLRLNAGRARDALLRIRQTLDRTDVRMADRRPYLHGETITLADLGLATAMAPLVLPSGYGAPMPALDRMPLEMKALIAECRGRPTGAYIEEIYQSLR